MTIERVRGLNEPVYQYSWNVIIPSLPGGGNAEALTFQARTSTIPGMGNEMAEVNHKADKLLFQGRDASDQSIELAFFDVRGLPVYKAFYNWKTFIHNRETGVGTDKTEYSTDVVLQMLARDDASVEGTWTLRQSHPEVLSPVDMDYSSSEPITITVTMRFDYFDMV